MLTHKEANGQELSPQIDLHIHCPLIFNNGSKTIQESKGKLCKVNICKQIDESWAPLPTMLYIQTQSSS